MARTPSTTLSTNRFAVCRTSRCLNRARIFHGRGLVDCISTLSPRVQKGWPQENQHVVILGFPERETMVASPTPIRWSTSSRNPSKIPIKAARLRTLPYRFAVAASTSAALFFTVLNASTSPALSADDMPEKTPSRTALAALFIRATSPSDRAVR